MGNNFTRDLADEAATLHFGAILAKAIQPNLTIYLHGDLGAGKTTLVRGLINALGYVGKVKSPTYTLVESYEIKSNVISTLNVYHFDLYRFNDDEEWEEAGFREYFNAQSVCLIEWPEKAQNVLPTPDLNVTITIKDLGLSNEKTIENSFGRSICISAHSTLGQQCLQVISAEAG
jgi:tRNA threonylcarbamoyladenosine biosynthesis protein TsaE